MNIKTRQIAFAIALGLVGSIALGGCAQVQKAFHVYDQVSAVQVTPKQAFAAIGVFDGLKVTATQYIRLPVCDGVQIICRDLEATRIIIIAVDEGTKARNNVKATARNGNVTGFSALTQATDTLKSVYTQYKIGRV